MWAAFYNNQVYFFCVNETFTRIFEIDGYSMADAALHAPNAPIFLRGVTHQDAGGEKKGHALKILQMQ